MRRKFASSWPVAAGVADANEVTSARAESMTCASSDAQALAIANDTPCGLGAGLWSGDGSRAYRFGRGIQAGRVWTNCYHAYPAHATFGGYKESGVGRETHKMMLDHYQQTKNLLVSYDANKLGFFSSSARARASPAPLLDELSPWGLHPFHRTHQPSPMTRVADGQIGSVTSGSDLAWPLTAGGQVQARPSTIRSWPAPPAPLQAWIKL